MLIARFEIAELPPKASEHWAKVHKAKQRWARVFAGQAAAQRLVPAERGERRVVIVELCRPSAQERDTDNLAAAMKVPLDVLSRAHGRKKIGVGALWDDDPAHLELHPFCVNEARRRTVVTVLAPGSDPHEWRGTAVQEALPWQ